MGDDPSEIVGRARVHRERMAVAADHLEEAIARPAGNLSAWKLAVQTAVIELSDALAAHVQEVEGPGGLYDDVKDRAPQLEHRVDALRHDHDDLRSMIAELEPILAERAAPEQVTRVRELTVTLLADLSRHRHRGADLIWDSYDYDIGAGD
jgi:hypothetical protein